MSRADELLAEAVETKDTGAWMAALDAMEEEGRTETADQIRPFVRLVCDVAERQLEIVRGLRNSHVHWEAAVEKERNDVQLADAEKHPGQSPLPGLDPGEGGGEPAEP